MNNRGKKPLVDILKNLKGLPMLDGVDWDEAKWDWKNSLLDLRKYISKKPDNIFIKTTNNLTIAKDEVN